ncbi:MAG: hypothetical protein AAF849_04575 [Bacteroidota bacterium]
MKGFLLIIFSFVSCSLFAQINEAQQVLNGTEQHAFSLVLPKTDQKTVEKAWMKFIKEYKGKTKADKKSGVIFTDNADLEDMSNNTVDVYAQVVPNGDATVLTVWYNLGGAYLNSEMHADKVGVGKDLINTFALTVSRAAIEEMLAAEEASLKDLQKEQEKLEKEKKDYENEIAKCEQKIKEAKQNIEKNETAQASQAEKIAAQQKEVDVVKEKLKKVE